ncbi:MAG: glycosyltransferase family 8 protein [Clostridia bacterium]|nr:glycosyltransferase family 8 protein [Clostridia bacterium]
MNEKKIIPVFYASDENYMPFLAVALTSLKEYANKEYVYKIHVLYTGVLNGYATKIREMSSDNFQIEFNDLSQKIDEISDMMHCRDYYTSAIYYRLFIPALFPQYDKAIYMDCDTVLRADIAELYAIDIGDDLIGAVADQAVAAVPEFREYTKNALDIDSERYFNSGVIVMNLKKFRETDFYATFCDVLRSYDFIVAPDQDCLNLICKDKVYYYDAAWNKMPIGGANECEPKLVHYNLNLKPWHYDGILYEEYFWAYAKKTPFYGVIVAKKAAFSPERAERDEAEGKRLIALAKSEADSPTNYIRSVGRLCKA